MKIVLNLLEEEREFGLFAELLDAGREIPRRRRRRRGRNHPGAFWADRGRRRLARVSLLQATATPRRGGGGGGGGEGAGGESGEIGVGEGETGGALWDKTRSL